MSDELRQRVGQRVRHLRKVAGLSINRLAEKAEVDPTYLGGIERGEQNPSLDVLERISVGLETTTASLVDDLDGLDDDEVRRRILQRLDVLSSVELRSLARVVLADPGFVRSE